MKSRLKGIPFKIPRFNKRGRERLRKWREVDLGKNMSITTKIASAFLIVILIFGVSLIIAFQQTASVRDGLNNLSIERKKSECHNRVVEHFPL